MKKQVFFAAAATMMALAFTSCKKYEVSGPLDLSELESVTVEGNLYAELDETNSVLEPASGRTVTVSIPYSDYNLDTSSVGNHIITTTTDANGMFSIRVPVVSSGVDATFSFESFTANVLYSVGVTGLEEDLEMFELSDVVINNLGAGSKKNLMDLGSLEYSSTSYDPNWDVFTPNTSKTYKGVITYERRLTNNPDPVEYEPLPEGSILAVYIYSEDEFGREYEEEKTVTVGAGGNYEIEVPIVKNGIAEIRIKVNEILQYDDDVAGESYLYLYQSTFNEDLYFVDYSNRDYQVNKSTLVQTL